MPPAIQSAKVDLQISSLKSR